MTFLDEIERLKRLDCLIRLKATGTPTQLAARLNVSERTVYNQIDTLRSLGAPVAFLKERNSYCYAYPIKLQLGVVQLQTEKN